MFLCYLSFLFFKQKTAYEMRISDWSSDVCSSDLLLAASVDHVGSPCPGRAARGNGEQPDVLLHWSERRGDRLRVRPRQGVRRPAGRQAGTGGGRQYAGGGGNGAQWRRAYGSREHQIGRAHV